MEDKESEPKTQTESSGGGCPPGRTRVGAGAEDSSNYFGDRPVSKYSLDRLQTEANEILSAMEHELQKEDKTDLKEIELLQDLFKLVFEEILTHTEDNRDALLISAALLKRFEITPEPHCAANCSRIRP